MEVVRYEAAGWGGGEILASDGRLVAATHPRRRSEPAPNLPQGMTEIPVVSVAAPASRVCSDFVTDLAQRLAAYFAGEPVRFDDVELDLDGATEFQRALAGTLRAVPRGETVTYGELAALAGRPNAQRAAGTFCAGNRFAIVVPCHRVVAAGGIGGYGSLGREYKRRLLALEGLDAAL